MLMAGHWLLQSSGKKRGGRAGSQEWLNHERIHRFRGKPIFSTKPE